MLLSRSSQQGSWRASYFEPLPKPHQGCRQVAQGLLSLFAPGVQLPDRENKQRQSGAQCGYWVIYFAEEVARRQKGEAPWGRAFSLEHRVDRLNKTLDRLESVLG